MRGASVFIAITVTMTLASTSSAQNPATMFPGAAALPGSSAPVAFPVPSGGAVPGPSAAARSPFVPASPAPRSSPVTAACQPSPFRHFASVFDADAQVSTIAARRPFTAIDEARRWNPLFFAGASPHAPWRISFLRCGRSAR